LLIGQRSLDDLNSRLNSPQNAGITVGMSRFRPNIVVSAADAYAEDHWKKIRIGNIEMHIVKPCSRCTIPSIEPETARKAAEPLKTLASYRMHDNKIFFGQNVIAQKIDPKGSSMLEVGMTVDIIE